MIENTQKTRNRGNFFNMVKDIYEKPKANSIFRQKTVNFPTKVKKKTRIIFHHCYSNCIGSTKIQNFLEKT